MKYVKRVAAIIISAVIASSIQIPSFAGNGYVNSGPILIDSDTTDTISAAEKLNIITKDIDRSSAITKKDLCRLIVRFYRASTGSTGITLSQSKFVDSDDNEVIFCSENGIVDGISDVTFAPDNFVTREEMCRYAVNTLKYSNINVLYPEKDYTSSLKDKSEISDEYKDDVNYLISIGVVDSYDSYIYPKSYITYDQVASIMVEMYYQFMLSRIEINGSQLLIGDDSNKVINSFGKPSYTYDDKSKGITIWCYNKDITKFFYIGIKDNRVSEIFSNSINFSYRGISSGDNFKNVEFGSRGTRDNNSVTYADGYGTVEIGWNSSSNAICYVYACSNDLSKKHLLSNQTIDGDISILYDIVNSERIKEGLKVFKIDSRIATSAKLHSMNMAYWEYLDYNNKYDLTPFERLKDKGIDAVMAAENIAKGANPKEILKSWIGSAGSRTNMFSEYMDNVGIGIYANNSGNEAYVTMDVVKLREYL